MLHFLALRSRSLGHAHSSRLVQNEVWRRSRQKQNPNTLLNPHLSFGAKAQLNYVIVGEGEGVGFTGGPRRNTFNTAGALLMNVYF
ncbi:MAG: hypothetical protein WBA12_13655 [Catalinimonas sp.]